MKKRLFLAFLLSLGVSATSYGRVSAPIREPLASEFRKVEISPNPTFKPILSQIYRDFDKKSHFSVKNKPNLPKIDKNKAKIEAKSTPKPRYNKPPYKTRAEAKAAALAYARGRLSHNQFSCLKTLWARESGWHYWKVNRYSGAYGIPQALPGSKMKSFGSDWRTNPITQVKWGINYVNKRYGSSCRALAFHDRNGWY